MGIIERCPVCDKPTIIIATPLDYREVQDQYWLCDACYVDMANGFLKKQGWCVGRIERDYESKDFSVEVEWICPHGIGHWKWAHGCCPNRCCTTDEYPPRHKDIMRAAMHKVIKENRDILKVL